MLVSRSTTVLAGTLRTPDDAASYVEVFVLGSAPQHRVQPLKGVVHALVEHIVYAVPWRSITLVATGTPAQVSITLLPHVPEGRLRPPDRIRGAFARGRRPHDGGVWHWDTAVFQGRRAFWAVSTHEPGAHLRDQRHHPDPPARAARADRGASAR
jgi:hypothetical protein